MLKLMTVPMNMHMQLFGLTCLIIQFHSGDTWKRNLNPIPQVYNERQQAHVQLLMCTVEGDKEPNEC